MDATSYLTIRIVCLAVALAVGTFVYAVRQELVTLRLGKAHVALEYVGRLGR